MRKAATASAAVSVVSSHDDDQTDSIWDPRSEGITISIVRPHADAEPPTARTTAVTR
jgi:hypothetical protein